MRYVYLLGFLLCGSAHAEANLKTYETYLNNARTLSADFHQRDQRGDVANGKFYLSRPGKMRFVYEKPATQTIVADGQWIIHQDKVNKEITSLAIDETPAAFFLRDRVSFQNGVTVTGVENRDNMIAITLVRNDDRDSGSLTLVFQQKPVALLSWHVIDAQENKTSVQLSNIKTNIPLKKELFVFNEKQLPQDSK